MNNSPNNLRTIRIADGLMKFSGIVLMISSFVKFLRPARAVTYMAFLGYSDEKLFLIAGAELAIAILFLQRSTRVPGLLLVSSYMGGAIAAHVAYHPLTSNAPIIMFDAFHPYLGSLPPVIVLVSAWLGAWLRRQELFGQFSNRQPDAQLRAVKAA